MIIQFTGQVDTRFIERVTISENGTCVITLNALHLDSIQIAPRIRAAIKKRYGNTLTGSELRTLLLKPLDHTPDSSP